MKQPKNNNNIKYISIISHTHLIVIVPLTSDKLFEYTINGRESYPVPPMNERSTIRGFMVGSKV